MLVIDLHLAEGRSAELKSAVNGTKILAMSFANDEEAEDSAKHIGAVKFLDKTELAQKMIPAHIAVGIIQRQRFTQPNEERNLIRFLMQQSRKRNGL